MKKLRNQFYYEIDERPDNFSEEYVRSAYLNKLLEIFGCNIIDTSEVIQEKVITNKTTRKNLKSIYRPTKEVNSYFKKIFKKIFSRRT